MVIFQEMCVKIIDTQCIIFLILWKFMSFGKEVRTIIIRGYYEHKVIKITLEK